VADDGAAAVMHRLFDEAYGRGRTDVVDELVALPYFAGHVKRLVAQIHATLSEVSCQIEETVAEGDKVVVRLALAGTHTGEFRHPLGSAAATGRRIAVSGICIGRIAKGKLVEVHQEWNTLGLLQQVGVLTTPTSGE
jgi:predicted ester cyclase